MKILNSKNKKFDAAIVVVGEDPYTEMKGDSDQLYLSKKDKKSIDEVKKMNIPYVVVLITGRPLIVDEVIDNSNAFLVAWLPGTEGGGVADVLFGEKNLQGKLSFSWPKVMEDIPCNYDNNCEPLFPLGFIVLIYFRLRSVIIRVKSEKKYLNSTIHLYMNIE